MYIKDYMTTDVITIDPNASMIDASDLMKHNNIHRLPVVEDGRLIGIITKATLNRHSPSGATSLSKYEVNYILDKTNVRDIMEKQVKVITPDHLLEQAAVIMRNENVGVLVVTEGEMIKGIITDKDIFKALTAISGYNVAGSSLVVEVGQDRRGVIEEIGDALLESDSNLTNLVVHHTDDGIRIVIHIDSEDGENLAAKLRQRNYTVRSVELKEL